MRKKTLLTILSFLPLYTTYAERVPIDQALEAATNFSKQISGLQLRSSQYMQLAYTAKSELRFGGDNTYFYVFNRGNNNGFIIISGDDRTLPVLGYSTTGDFSYSQAPENMKWWLGEYADQIQYACQNIKEANATIRSAWKTLLAEQSELRGMRTQTLLKTATWDQGAPFNEQCPVINGGHAVTGCVATAMAIVMKYHKYPAQGIGSATTDQGYSADFNVTYDWDNMLDDYLEGSSGTDPNYTQQNIDAVARLNYHCGVSCNMKYGLSESGAQSARILNALTLHFQYDKSVLSGYKDDYAPAEWTKKIDQELAEQRPVIYSGSGTGGHSFVLDGSDGEMYHFNWGWGGRNNGYFSLSALNPGDGYNYTSEQFIIYNIKPNEGGNFANQVRLCVTQNSNQQKGLVVDKQPEPGKRFTVNYPSLHCESPSFQGAIAIAHCDKNGKIKDIISNEKNLEFHPFRIWSNGGFTCQTKLTVEEGDYACMVLKIDVSEYKIVEGDPDLITSIELIPGESKQEFRVTHMSYPTGVVVIDVEGYNRSSIMQGEEYKFTLNNPDNLKLIVTCNGEVITPDVNGIYTVSNVQDNLNIEIKKDTDVANKIVTASKAKVRASNGTLYISTPQPAKVSIITATGSLCKSLGTVNGEANVVLPKGFYVVIVGDESFKVLIES